MERERARTREVEHRVRNTLQLISSLVVLQGRKAPPEAKPVLAALQQRISAVTAVHRGFVPAAGPDRFDLTGYVREHLAGVVQNLGPQARLEMELEPVETAASAAAPLALILQELAANATTHGLSAGQAGCIRVRLSRAGETYSLTVQDDGPGLPAEPEAQGLGLSLARLMCQQIRARLDLQDAQPGLRAVVTGS